MVLLAITLYAHTGYTESIQVTPIYSSSNTTSQEQAYQRPAYREQTYQRPIDKIPPTPAQETPVKAEETMSEFERFIAGEIQTEISTNISQFGYDLFRMPPTTFAPANNVSVGPDYIIGPEDEIKVTIWGKVDGNWNVTVNRDGTISLPKIGVIGVAGLTFKEMKAVIYKEISRYYTGFEMNVSMGLLRTIRIYIVGNAKQPGAYTVSSLSSLVSALFEAGGPNKTGTMRDIQLKRNGETIVHFDMYDLLMKGDKIKDLRLQSEDVIFIPQVGPLAGIAGNVNRPAIYELNDETRLLQLINMAGGLTSIAFKGRVQVQRTENHEFRTLFEGDLLDMGDNEGKNFLLHDGDLVKVFSVTESNDTVYLSGAVENQGEYAIIPGTTRIKDVILKAGGVQYYSSNQAELTRTSVTQAGPLREIIEIDISKVLNEDPEQNIPLEKNDYLFIRTVPEWNIDQKVNIEGEVKFPGFYIIKKNETLSSLIERAGGYTDNAYLRGAVFTRERVRDIQQKSIAQMAAKIERELFAESSAKISTAVTKEEIAARESEAKQKKELIETLYKIKATGRMTIRLTHLRLLKNTEYDIALEEKDSLFIPKKNSVVNVLGAVMSRGSFVYTGDFDYKDYIGLAGGYTNYADNENVYVLKVDGTAMKLSSGFFNWNDSKSRWDVAGFEKIKEVEPGDSIVVPEKFERIAWMRGMKDISQILYQIAVAAAVVIDLL